MCVITDYGGLQEETVPCITIRTNTKQPVTVDLGLNTMVNNNVATVSRILDQKKSEIIKKVKYHH